MRALISVPLPSLRHPLLWDAGVSISLSLAKPVPGEGANSWILMEEEGERGGAAAEMQLGNTRKAV